VVFREVYVRFSCCNQAISLIPFRKHQFLERLTAQIQRRAIKDLGGMGEGLVLEVFGTLFLKSAMDATDRNPKLAGNSP
jgi:hypothetical protein